MQIYFLKMMMDELGFCCFQEVAGRVLRSISQLAGVSADLVCFDDKQTTSYTEIL